MNANQWYSLLLLIGRVITVVLILKVVPKQYQQLKAQNYPQLQRLRNRLFVSSIILLVGNFVPITIDVFGLFNMGSFGLLLLYVFSNNITAMLSAYMTYTVYRISETTEIIDE